ncbi:MAG: lytic transglycosylase domain-containing protein [Clostridia bacterium]|nr:lytic transglycosylase domain-containing protein [Clostridia bacterium]
MKIIAIILIIAVAFGLAVGINLLLNKTEEGAYPQKYSEYVTEYASEYNVPEYVIYAVIKVESNFDPLAKSSAGACGLMQMMPNTFLWLTGEEHLNENLSAEAIYMPEVSIRYGTYYLNYLYKKFNYNWDTAFAAYNAGEGNVSDWLEDPEYSDGEGNLTEIPFSETRSYVSKVNSAIDTYKELYYETNEGVAV